jgi:hypothetical protein
MRTQSALWIGLGLALLLWSGAAMGQGKPPCDPQQIKAASPEKVEGKVVKVDTAANKVIVQDQSGKTYEFHASSDTLREIKLGEPIEAKLRSTPNC